MKQDLFGPVPESDKAKMCRLRKAAEAPFIRNDYGLWCPNCEERIDEMWPDSCDCCGYPNKDYDRFDDDDWEHAHES